MAVLVMMVSAARLAILQQRGRAIEQAVAPQEAVIHHLGGEAALIVEDERAAQESGERTADQRAFVQMGVDEVGAEGERGADGARGERDIEVELVARGADDGALDAGEAEAAPDGQAVDRVAVVVGADDDPMAARLQAAGLFEDPNVTPIVGEEGRWCDHQDAQLPARSHVFLHTSCQMSRSIPSGDDSTRSGVDTQKWALQGTGVVSR
ncbi:MAG: hypothetical protein U0232_26300 [Thermomicrobiales bacterium]